MDCFVIDAKSKHGTYTVWLDPEHGYGIAKAEVYKGPEHLRFGRPRSSFEIADDTSTISVQNVRFENMEGVWIPVEADEHFVKDEEKRTHVFDTHYRIRQMILNPDHDKLGSFVLDIENGTKVRLEEAPRIQYLWQDGKIVSDINDAIIAEIDQITTMILAKSPQSAVAPNQPSSPIKAQSQQNPQQTADVAKAQPDRSSKPARSCPVLQVVLIGCLAIGGIIWLVARRRTKG